jgi:hypothetical protein
VVFEIVTIHGSPILQYLEAMALCVVMNPRYASAITLMLFFNMVTFTVVLEQVLDLVRVKTR